MIKLKIYDLGLKLVKDIYKLIKNNKIVSKDYSLSDQLKRAAVSVPCNISEGAYTTKKQFVNYLRIAAGSSNEVVALLKIVELVYSIKTDVLQSKYTALGKQINSLIKRIKTHS